MQQSNIAYYDCYFVCWRETVMLSLPTAWFYRYILGIRVNPNDNDANYIEIYLGEISSASYAEGIYKNENGSIGVKWTRNAQGYPDIQISTAG